jgi:hypothetical protein
LRNFSTELERELPEVSLEPDELEDLLDKVGTFKPRVLNLETKCGKQLFLDWAVCLISMTF